MRGDIRVSEALYQERLRRMAKILSLDQSPRVLVWYAAHLLLSSFEPLTLRDLWWDWQMKHAPHWLLMVVNKHYRQAQQEEEWL